MLDTMCQHVLVQRNVNSSFWHRFFKKIEKLNDVRQILLIGMIKTMDDLMIIAEKGVYYNPATAHYQQADANVTCDRCKMTRLGQCFGSGELDLCVNCVTELLATKISQLEERLYTIKAGGMWGRSKGLTQALGDTLLISPSMDMNKVGISTSTGNIFPSTEELKISEDGAAISSSTEKLRMSGDRISMSPSTETPRMLSKMLQHSLRTEEPKIMRSKMMQSSLQTKPPPPEKRRVLSKMLQSSLRVEEDQSSTKKPQSRLHD